jgi:hypothetical protein
MDFHFFNKDEFPRLPKGDVARGAMDLLRNLSTGRSAGMTRAEFEKARAQMWQVVALLQELDGEAALIPALKARIGELSSVIHSMKLRIPINRGASRPTIDLDLFKSKVSMESGMGWPEIVSKERKEAHVRARTMAGTAIISYKIMGYKEAGRFLGGRDHTTIMHGVKNTHAAFYMSNPYRSGYDAVDSWMRINVKYPEIA